MAEESEAIVRELSTLSTPPTVGTTVEANGEANASSSGVPFPYAASTFVRGCGGTERRGSYEMHASREKIAFARELRKRPTLGEALLWQQIRRKALGVGFRRQKLLLGWIVDFYCPQERLVVEIDGSSHANRRAADARRDEVMRLRGFSILRIPEKTVRADMPLVLRQILFALGARR